MDDYHETYELNPIVLTGGIATDDGLKISDLLGKGFAYFRPLDGTQLLSYSVAEHPVYNLETAATAVMRNPLTIQFLMIVLKSRLNPTALQHDKLINFINQLRLHSKKGGLFIIATPFYTYQNVIITEITQANIEEPNFGLQNGLHLTFRKSLVDLEDAANAYNEQMDRLDKGLPPKSSTKEQVMESLF